ncbi:siderophore ABC transporter substrate-binding protein [Vibrio cincinnatiensis]|uniref:siderophore ABC transporter substrate-binding protein n=1 Tax=Vibrio cincinnatiensis TaxID=675 RepID=UPI0012AC8912|nr:siderophore ABC transporter substrate-binding protein [Vibrio cincinnatiensis]
MKSVMGWAAFGLFASLSVQAANVTIEHQMGKTTLEQNPQRVVVIGIGPLDAVHHFGINPVAVSKVAELPDYLAQYRGAEYAPAGSLFEPDFERIYMQKPDVIITGPRAARTAYDELSKIAPTVVFAVDDSQPYWESTQAQWRNLGKLFAIEDKVEAKIAELDNTFTQVHDYNQKHQAQAMTVMSSGGNITTFGANSRFAAIYKDFGFREAATVKQTANHGNLISYEYIRQNNPQTLFIIDRDRLVNKGESRTREEFENTLIKATDAYQQHRMVFLDLNAWYLAIAGVTATEQMLSDMQVNLHQE